jgi:cytidylate kinase
MASIPVLTLDGPSGSGKGTVGQCIALELGWHYLDSGAIYRALALAAIDQACDPEDVKGLVKLAQDLRLQFHLRSDDVAEIEVNGDIVNDRIRLEETGEMASKVSPYPEVRESLMQLQKAFEKPPGLVADGRDMGTVVFPNAQFKVFLTASAEVRAKRRFDQLNSKGFDVNLARLIESIQARDVRDSSRKTSPLKPADDAYLLDSSNLSIDEVVARILDLIKQS